MPSFFSRLKGKDGPTKASKKKGAQQALANDAPPKPRWEDAWTRKTVEPEEVQELLRGCTLELKSKGMYLLHIFPLSIMHQAMKIILLRYTGLICRFSQLSIRRSCSFLFDRPQIPARRELSFDTFLTGVNYMERVWRKNYG